MLKRILQLERKDKQKHKSIGNHKLAGKSKGLAKYKILLYGDDDALAA